MMETSRYDPSCGLIRNPENGAEIVLAGYGTSEIFNLESMTWREGPESPYFYYASSAQLENTFLIVGGYDGTKSIDTIYEFDQINYDWILRSQKLPTPLRFSGVVVVPKDTIGC